MCIGELRDEVLGLRCRRTVQGYDELRQAFDRLKAENERLRAIEKSARDLAQTMRAQFEADKDDPASQEFLQEDWYLALMAAFDAFDATDTGTTK